MTFILGGVYDHITTYSMKNIFQSDIIQNSLIKLVAFAVLILICWFIYRVIKKFVSTDK